MPARPRLDRVWKLRHEVELHSATVLFLKIMIYLDHSSSDVPKEIQNLQQHPVLAEHACTKYCLTNSCTVLCTQPNFLRSFRERKGRKFWPRSSVIKHEKRATCVLSAPKRRTRGGGHFLSAFSVQTLLRSRKRLLGMFSAPSLPKTGFYQHQTASNRKEL